MKRAAMVALLDALLVLALCAAGGAAQELVLEHKLLLLTTGPYRRWATGFLEKTMLGYGAPLEVLEVDAPGGPPDLASLLWERPGGAGRFSAFLMHPDLEAAGALTRRQISDLADYARQTGARSVKFGAAGAAAASGLAPAACGATPAALRFTSATPFGVSGVRPGAVLALAGIQRCPAADPGPSLMTRCCSTPAGGGAPLCGACRAAPVLRSGSGIVLGAPAAASAAPAAPAAAQQFVDGVLVNHADGRQAMAFFLDCSEESAACWALGHLAAAWALRNIIPGARRALLPLQVDDLFLSTENGAGAAYRATPDDLATLLAWQDTLSARLPPGSGIRAEMVFNGNGVLLQSSIGAPIYNAPPCFETQQYRDLNCSCWGRAMADCPADAHWFCRSCVKDWKRVRGAPGVTYAPVPDTTAWSDAAFAAGDALYRLVRGSERVKDGFFWSSHTFSHQMLDNVTGDTMRLQLELNNRMAADGFLGLSSRATYSPASLVTPAISGLFNGDALAAIAAAGVTAVSGDNTWAMLLSPAGPHRMLYTTDATNGYPWQAGQYALAVMPRWSTAIPYSASTLPEALATWNADQTNPALRAASLDALLASEADRVLREALLPLRYDAHMFHQANLRVLGSGGPGSLLMLWAEAVASRLAALVDWPVRSLRMDDLKALFIDREARDGCQLSYKLTVSRGAAGGGGGVTRVNVTSGAPGAPACAAPLLVRAGVSLLDARGAPVPTQPLTPVVEGGPRGWSIPVPPGGTASVLVGGAGLPWHVGAPAG